MQTRLTPEFHGDAAAREAETIVRKCVHCGFCLATCPTYQLLGDELDSPRGRIYLVKQVLEGQAPGGATQVHLDRCLTCRNCETTCPSGVEFGRLIDIGRELVERRVERPLPQRAARWLLKEGLTSRALAPALAAGTALRPFAPRSLREKLPAPRAAVSRWPARGHPQKVILLAGCVQPGLMPDLNPATARVLDAIGIQTLIAPGAGCCGALRQHLADRAGALEHMRRNIDAWWPRLQAAQDSGGAIAVVANASGCGVVVKEYGHYLAHDVAYAHKARLVSERTRDLAEIVAEHAPRLAGLLHPAPSRIAVHVPCTLQHGQRLPALLPGLLRRLGFDAQVDPREGHLCCGSAGTYSLLQPELAGRLRERKLAALRALGAPIIVSANIGCIRHLEAGTELRVCHWVELVDELLAYRAEKSQDSKDC